MNIVEELINEANLINPTFSTETWRYAKLMRIAAKEIQRLEKLNEEYFDKINLDTDLNDY